MGGRSVGIAVCRPYCPVPTCDNGDDYREGFDVASSVENRPNMYSAR